MTRSVRLMTKFLSQHTVALLLTSLILLVTSLTGCGSGTTAGTGGASGPVAQGSTSGTSPAPYLPTLGKADPGDFVPIAPEDVLAAKSSDGQVKVLITYRTLPGATEESGVASKRGTVRHRFRFVNVIAATVPASSVDALRADPRVARVEADLPIQALGELDNTWGVNRIGSGTVHAGGNRGTGIKVAVIDSGIDYTHPDLAANYAGGYDFVNNDADPRDDNGHGTHCAGTVAARADGVGVIGVAPEARIYALKVLDSTGSGSFSSIIAALQWCVDNKIQVTSNSYGSSGNPGTTVEDAFRKAEAAGIINVAAAGNNGTAAGTEDNVNYPARYASCVAVAASDSNNARATFSCTGPKIEVAAPGVGVNSTTMGGGYAAWSGTSMATPHVAGAVALALKAGLAPADVRARLQATSLDLGTAGRDTWYGYGLVQAVGLSTVGNTAPTVTISSPTANASIASGATITFSGTANDTLDGDLSSRLTWTVNNTTYSGASFTAALPDGTYTATASVTDAGGLTGSASVTFTVANAAPVVTITAPTSGSTFALGASVTFSGTALDREDGTLTAGLVWTIGSTIIGRGGSFATASLPAGTSTVTATSTDSRGLTGSKTVTVTVGSPQLGVRVTTDKLSYVNKNTASITTTVSAGTTVVAGAAVQVTLVTANGKRYVANGTTSTAGTVLVRYGIRSSIDGIGTYTVTSTASKTGYTTGTGTVKFSVTK